MKMMVYVLKNLVSNMSIILLITYFLSKTLIFKNLVTGRQNSLAHKLLMAVIFGLIGILATYTGISVHGAIANSRIIGVLVGGIFGGPLVGLGAGLIAGIHRWIIDFGGFTAFACCLSTVVEGVIGGLVAERIKNKPHNWIHAFIVGMFAEILQMFIILLFAKPSSAAWELVKILWIPMVMFNPVGISFFVGFIDGIYKEREKEAALQTKLALDIADRCLAYLRKGLTAPEIVEVARIILQMSGVAAVAITDRCQIMAHVGLGAEHHTRHTPLRTQLTQTAVKTGQMVIANTQAEIGCSDGDCKLKSAVIVPLFNREEVIGAIKIYLARENAVSDVHITLATGLARLFSTQLELAEIDFQKKLCQKAELRALQSQINPHFLFNALNTIVSFCRTQPERARELLISLSVYFRKTLTQTDHFIRLDEELKLIGAYLELETARFEGKLHVTMEISTAVEACILPQFILQPLVENAVKHGVLPLEKGGTVAIIARKDRDETTIVIEDNGVGISETILNQFKQNQLPRECIGLSNVDQRLKKLYGANYGLQIVRKDRGTLIRLKIPDWAEGDFAGDELSNR
jgi:two-component system sensor histidine kinase LytS